MKKTFYLGLDISKGYADIIILDINKREVEPCFQLDDTFDGHTKLYKLLSELCKKHNPDHIDVAVESTEGYENNWYNALTRFQNDLPLSVARLNPLGVHFNSKADLKRVTTDAISARSIAEYLISHPEKVDYNCNDSYSNLRRQRTFVRMLKTQKTQLLNQLESLYYTSFPEIVTYCHGGVPHWVLKLLKQYPTANRLKKVKPETLSKMPYISLKRAKELINYANQSVASSFDSIIENLIKDTIIQIMNLENAIDKQTRQMIKECDIPELELLKSFPGISDWSAIGLIIEIGTIERFSNAKKLVSYFGINPAFRQSGDGISKVRMSKQGRIEPRRILYMVSLVGLNHNKILKYIYNKHVSAGMAKSAAIGVCMHKTLRIIYGMWSSLFLCVKK